MEFPTNLSKGVTEKTARIQGQGHAFFSRDLYTIRKTTPDMFLSPSRKEATDHKASSYCETRTYHALGTLSTKSQSQAEPTAIHHQTDTVHLVWAYEDPAGPSKLHDSCHLCHLLALHQHLSLSSHPGHKAFPMTHRWRREKPELRTAPLRDDLGRATRGTSSEG